MDVIKVSDLALEKPDATLTEIFMAADKRAFETKTGFTLDVAGHFGLPEALPEEYCTFEGRFGPWKDPYIDDLNLAHKLLAASIGIALFRQEQPLSLIQPHPLLKRYDALGGVLMCLEYYELADHLWKDSAILEGVLQDLTQDVAQRFTERYGAPKLVAA